MLVDMGYNPRTPIILCPKTEPYHEIYASLPLFHSI